MQILHRVGNSQFWRYNPGQLCEYVVTDDGGKVFIYLHDKTGKVWASSGKLEAYQVVNLLETYNNTGTWAMAQQQMLPGFTPWDLVEGLSHD